MKTLETWSDIIDPHGHLTQGQLLENLRLFRNEVLEETAALARKREAMEFLELADKIEALKSLP